MKPLRFEQVMFAEIEIKEVKKERKERHCVLHQGI